MNKKLNIGMAIVGSLGIGLALGACNPPENTSSSTSSSSVVTESPAITFDRNAPTMIKLGETFNLDDIITVAPAGATYTISSNNDVVSINGHSITVNKLGTIDIKVTHGTATNIIRSWQAQAVSEDFYAIHETLSTVKDNYTMTATYISGTGSTSLTEIIHNEDYYMICLGRGLALGNGGYADLFQGMIEYPNGHTYNAYMEHDFIVGPNGTPIYTTDDPVLEIQNGMTRPKESYVLGIDLEFPSGAIIETPDEDDPTKGTISMSVGLDENGNVDSDLVNYAEQWLLYGTSLAYDVVDLSASLQAQGINFGKYAYNEMSILDGDITASFYDINGNEVRLDMTEIGTTKIDVIEEKLESGVEPTPLKFEALNDFMTSINGAGESPVHSSFTLKGEIYAGGVANISIPQLGVDGGFFHAASEEAATRLAAWSNGYLGQMVEYGAWTATVEGETYYSVNDETGKVDAYLKGDDGYLYNVYSGSEDALTARSFSDSTDSTIWDGMLSVVYSDADGGNATPSYLSLTPGVFTEERLGEIDYSIVQDQGEGSWVALATPYGDAQRLLTWFITAIPQAGSLAYLFLSGLSSVGGEMAWYDFFDSVQINLYPDGNGGNILQMIMVTTGFGVYDTVDTAVAANEALDLTGTEYELAPGSLGTQQMDTGLVFRLEIGGVGTSAIDDDAAAALDAAMAAIA